MPTGIKHAAQSVDSATIMGLLPTRPQLLALGEPTHSAHGLLSLRNELFQQLVEQEGYRTIALETDALAGTLVDDYVTGEAPAELSLHEVLERGLSHEWGALPGNRDLVRWMRAYNERRPAPDQLHFAGFDGPLEIAGAASPRPVLTALHDHLSARLDPDLLPCTAQALDRLIGSGDRWTDPDAMLDPSRSVGQTAQARELRLLADDLVALLHAQAPQLIATSSPKEWDRARLYGRTATGLLRYHFWMAEPSQSRMTWLLSVRDTMMANNLLALAERGPVLVNAHNSHLQRHQSTMTMWHHPRLQWWSAGALVSARIGQQYAFLTTALGTMRHQGVDTPPSDTVEGLLYALGEERCVVDTPHLAAALAAAPGDTPVARVSPWFGYSPLDPEHLADSDALVFVRDLDPGPAQH